MPKYNYYCSDCETSFEEVHLMSETVDSCRTCDSKEVNRIPYEFVKPKIQRQRKPGDVVKEFIENEKEELRRQKDNLSI